MSLRCKHLFSTTVALRPSLRVSNLAKHLKYTAELKESAIPICVRAKQPLADPPSLFGVLRVISSSFEGDAQSATSQAHGPTLESQILGDSP